MRSYKGFFGIGILVIVLTAAVLTGCLDNADAGASGSRVMAAGAKEAGLDGTKTSDSKTDGPASQISGQAPPVLLTAAEIMRGDFDSAASSLAKASDDLPGVEQLRAVLDEYESMQASREQARRKAFEKQLEELDELRQEVEDLSDVNDLSAAFSVLFNARGLATDEEKARLLEDAFVKRITREAKEKAKINVARGDYAQALSHGYSWLAALYEDDDEYEEMRDRVREMYIIKESLTDNLCETRAQRFSGITADMLVRAINVLDIYHVKVLDYDAMAREGLKRLNLLGEVVGKADTFDEKLAREPSAITAWQKGLGELEDQIRASILPLSKNQFLSLFEDVISLNDEGLKLPREIVVAMFAEATLTEVDPYTNLVWPWQISEFEKNMTQEFTGIGIEINKVDGKLKVASLLPDTPASVSGLDAGDIIEKVDGEPTDDMTLQCAVRKITGPAGTSVTLTVRHEGSDETEDIRITRAKIVVPTIRGWLRTDEGKWDYMIDPNNGIGYIRITGFAEKTSEHFEEALKELKSQGMKGLIVDLRHNTGGYLQSAVDIVDKFVDEGPIVGTRPRFGYRTSEVAKKKGTHPDFPMVILINSSSASASEIVAGALADPLYKRATLVGARTYGKGSVQQIIVFPGGRAQLKYTMAYYHLPSGQRVNGRYEAEKTGSKDWGVAPDIEVEIISDEARKMIEIQRANDILVRAGHDNESAPVTRHEARELVQADPQLNTAILVARTKLIASQYAVLASN